MFSKVLRRYLALQSSARGDDPIVDDLIQLNCIYKNKLFEHFYRWVTRSEPSAKLPLVVPQEAAQWAAGAGAALRLRRLRQLHDGGDGREGEPGGGQVTRMIIPRLLAVIIHPLRRCDSCGGFPRSIGGY